MNDYTEEPMPDIFTRAKRSDVMSRIRSRGNRNTELRMVEVFRSNGMRGWRRHARLRGEGQVTDRKIGKRVLRSFTFRPDFIFPKLKVAVFVDGCFWHACPKCYIRPKQNRTFWDEKREMNQARDRKQSRALRKKGWTVVRLWEHDLAKKREKWLLGKLRRVFAMGEQ
ncbi:very short patch repair endonuclease [Roseimicrobium gellanilyticum]|uniref:very short patch repair endonuclease n=1 Tax=Roseimicrobium gellanilyticum TaxID=748857 RepID=UPI001FE67B70|nr:very short patch repair endonuclease [Roseimicrobium gellanilyticum]